MDPSNLAKLLERKAELDAVLGRFEIWLLVFGVLVVIGVGGESFFGIRTWWNNRKLQEINRQLDQYRETELAEINRKAAEAEAKAEGFRSSIAEANRQAKEAEEKAEKFRLDIAKANEQAEEAKDRAAQANLEVAKFKSPRSLIHVPELIAALKKFEGTKYAFSGLFQNVESFELLKRLDEVLQQAGWKREQPERARFPSLDVSWSDIKLSVPISLGTGINISVDSPEKVETLQSLPANQLPPIVQAAVTLDIQLSNSLSPSEKATSPVNTVPGTSPVLRIDIGQKPNE